VYHTTIVVLVATATKISTQSGTKDKITTRLDEDIGWSLKHAFHLVNQKPKSKVGSALLEIVDSEKLKQ
jgi:hypothetical protein